MVVARRGGGRGTKNFVGSRQSKASGTGRWQQRRTKGPGTPNWDMIQNPKGLILSDSLGVPISASLVSTQHTHTHKHQSILPADTETRAHPWGPSPLGSNFSPDHPPQHYGEGWELRHPLLLPPSRSAEESYVSNLHVLQPPQPGHRTQKANSLLSLPAQPLGYFYLPLSWDHKG